MRESTRCEVCHSLRGKHTEAGRHAAIISAQKPAGLELIGALLCFALRLLCGSLCSPQCGPYRTLNPLDLFAERHKRIARRRVAHGRLQPERLLRLLQRSAVAALWGPCGLSRVCCGHCTDTMCNVGCHATRSVAPLLHQTCHCAIPITPPRPLVCLFVCGSASAMYVRM